MASLDRADVVAVVSSDGMALGRMEEHWRSDREVVWAAVRNCAAAFRSASGTLKSDRVFLLDLVVDVVEVLDHVPESFLDDEGFMMAACRRNVEAIAYASSRVRDLLDIAAIMALI